MRKNQPYPDSSRYIGSPPVNPHESYESCTLCPRNCGVNRLQAERGFCGESAQVRVAWAGLHRGEEPPLVGEHGSGTIFFSGCTLKCDSCQNCQLSREGMGAEVSDSGLVEMMLRLQERRAANINLVTASHFAPSAVEVIVKARQRGLSIPVVWNSSGYEKASTLELLRPVVDLYLPDCKTLDARLSRSLMKANNYPQIVRSAVLKMVAGKPPHYAGGKLRRGVIMRHLVLPDLLEQTREVLCWFAAELKGRALLSLMFQFTPVHRETEGMLARRTISVSEYEEVLSWLEELEIEEGFVQDPADSDEWLPDFTRLNPFPQDQAEPLWHYKCGYID